MPTIRTLAAAALALTAAGPALAQMRPEAPGVTYREGMPAVNTPAPGPAPDAANSQASAAFARWYAAAGRPSILLFWNRELIEDATTLYDQVQSSAAIGAARSDGAAVAGSGGYAVGGYGAVAGESARYGAASRSSAAMVASESRQYQERTTDSRYAIADPTYGHGVESAISSTLISAGAKIVSREALMRKVSTGKSKEARLDIQYLETLAMGQGVQYLMEVLPDPDATSPTGVSFTVKVTHLPTSTVKTQFVTTGAPPKGQAKWVAVNGAGFEKRTETVRATPQLIGAQIAFDTMSRLR